MTLTLPKIYSQPLIVSSLLILPVIEDLTRLIYWRNPTAECDPSICFCFLNDQQFACPWFAFQSSCIICSVMLILSSRMFLKCLCISQHRISRWTYKWKESWGRMTRKRGEKFWVVGKRSHYPGQRRKIQFWEKTKYTEESGKYIKQNKMIHILLLAVVFWYFMCFLEYLKSCIVLDKWKKQTFSTYCCFTFIYKFYEFYSFWGVILLHWGKIMKVVLIQQHFGIFVQEIYKYLINCLIFRKIPALPYVSYSCLNYFSVCDWFPRLHCWKVS